MKKRWEKPELVVLVRGEPGEAILAACKSEANPSGGPTQIQVGSICQENLVSCEPCSEAIGS